MTMFNRPDLNQPSSTQESIPRISKPMKTRAFTVIVTLAALYPATGILGTPE